MAELAGLHARITGDSSGLVAALGAGQRAVTETQRRIDGLVGVSDRLANSAAKSAQAFREFDRAKAAVDRLRSSYDPLFAASRQYEIAVDEITEALRLGVVSQGQYEAMLDNLGQSYLTAAGQMNVLGQSMRASTQHTTNLMFQFQDIGMMLAAGQSPLMLAMQQGTQVAGVFQQMKNEGQSAFRGIIGGLAGVISPMSLVTIGTIAGVAALGQWAISAIGAKDEAQKLTDTLDALDTISSTVNGANEILSMSVQDLTEKYGQYAEAVREAARSQLMLAEAEAAQRLRGALADVSDALDGLTQRSGTFLRSGTTLAAAIGNIADQLGISRQEAQAFEGALRRLETAGNLDQQVAALREIERLLEASGADAANLPPPLIEALQQLNAMVISSADIAQNLNAATVEAAAFNEALNGGGFGEDSRARRPPPRAPALLGEPDVTRRQSGGGGGVGSGLAAQVESDLEALRTGFMTQEELQLEAFATQQEILQMALEQRLLTQQEYNELMQSAESAHAMEMANIKQQEAAMVSSAQTAMYNELGGLLGMFANKSKAAAIAQIALNKGLRIAEIIQNTAAAQMRAIAELGPIAGPTAAAKIGAYGKIQAGIVAATGLAQAGGALSGGSSGGAASSGGGGAAAGGGGAAQPAPATQTVIIDGPAGMDLTQFVNMANEAQKRGYFLRFETA